MYNPTVIYRTSSLHDVPTLKGTLSRRRWASNRCFFRILFSMKPEQAKLDCLKCAELYDPTVHPVEDRMTSPPEVPGAMSHFHYTANRTLQLERVRDLETILDDPGGSSFFTWFLSTGDPFPAGLRVAGKHNYRRMAQEMQCC